MTRKEFMEICGVLGLGLAAPLALPACRYNAKVNAPFKGRVLIVGAGAGGLSAGYLLAQAGVDFEILEASPAFGGRMKINRDFADFPIPLGAEWLETGTDIFRKIVNDPDVPLNVATVPDPPDRKFVNYSWYQFFEDYILPSVAGRISYGQIVESIDYSGGEIRVSTQNADYTADKVIVSVPLQILRDGDIQFIPSLPQSKQDAMRKTVIWDGFKAFVEFSARFYDEEYVFDVQPPDAGQKIYYDAAYGQNSSMHILGLFAVGKPAEIYASLSDSELKDLILSELDALYSNQAGPNYIKHISQNWKKEAFIKSGYISENADWKDVRELGKSLGGKVYFAGGAYTDGEDWVSVHVAALSAKRAVEELSA